MTLPEGGALVTGGSGAIGSAVVEALARGGMDVTVGYGSDRAGAEAAAETARDHGADAWTAAADVTVPEEADALVETAAKHAPLRVLVNCVGLTDPAAIDDLTPETLRQCLTVNVEGAANVIRPAASHLRLDGGAVVNVSSIAAEIGTVDAAYAASKGGLLGLTRALARELGRDAVRVNAVAPGPVDTPMNDRIVEFLEEQRFQGHRTVDTLLDRYEAQPEEVASAVSYLAGASFVTGEVLHVDGGMSL